MIDFPASPTLGQQFTAQGVVWTFDGTKWTASGLNVAYVPTAGGTMTGPLVLAADPTLPLGAATAQYADKARWGDNRIINGDCRIDQRNNGASGTAGGYTVDRWRYDASQAAKETWQQGNSGLNGFPKCLTFMSSSAYSLLASDYFLCSQNVEADMVSDFAWGTSSAQSVTLSFWVFSTLTGTFGGSIENAATTRAYPFTYSIPSASVWTKIVITIPGDTAGTWVMSGNAASVGIHFDLGSGSTYRGPPGAWAGVNYTGATGAVSPVTVNGSNWSVTGVKLEIGSIATPFNRQSLAKTMADCQRYYEKSFNGALGSGFSLNDGEAFGASHPAGSFRGGPSFRVTKRANASISVWDNTGAPGCISYYTTTWNTGGSLNPVPTASTAGFYCGHGIASSVETQFAWAASAEL